MAWDPKRPEEEGEGNYIRRRAYAWSLGKGINGQPLVPPSTGDTVAYSTNTSAGTGPGHNLRVTNGIVTQWWCTEGASTTLNDSSLLTVETDLGWVTAQGGQWSQDAAKSNRWYLNLSGGGKADNLASSEIFTSVTGAAEKGLTVEAWFKPTAAAGADNPGPGRILSFSNPSDPTHDINFMLGHGSWTGAGYANTNYHGRIRIGDNTTHIWSGDGVATTNLQHVVMTCEFLAADANNSDRAEVKLYVDNVLKTTVTPNVPSPDLFYDWTDQAKIVLGAEHDNSRKANGGYYLGAVYDRALNSGEVGENYTEGVVSITNAYLTGNTAYIYGEPESIIGGETKTLTIGINGSRIGNVTCTLDASAPGMTEGVDFVLSTSTVVVAKSSIGESFTLSCSPALSADVNIGVALTAATGSNTISPVAGNVDLVTIPAISKTIKPELKIAMDNDPQHMVGGVGFGNIQAWRVAKSRPYYENIDFHFSGIQASGNLADYYFLSGGSTAGFSAPYQPSPATTGPNNTEWKLINGPAVSLSSYSGPMTITVDGTVIENANIINQGPVNVKASNVIIRNCKIISDTSFYNINSQFDECSNLLIEDCEFSGIGTFTTSNGTLTTNSALVNLHKGTMRRCNLHDCAADLLKVKDDCTVELNYFHNMSDTNPTVVVGAPHADASQGRGGTANLLMRWNYFDIPSGQNIPSTPGGYTRIHSAAAIIQAKGSIGNCDPVINCIIDSNWIRGGSNALVLTAVHNDWQGWVINNKFSGRYSDWNNNDVLPDYVNWLLQNSESNGFTTDIVAFNNRLEDGNLAPTNASYNNTYGSNNTGFIDNVTEPPVIPGYDMVGVENKIDFSAGIHLGFGPDEEVKTVPITCSAGATGGVFAADDSLTGYIISGSIQTGSLALCSLSVVSSLSSNEIIFDPPPLPGIGNNPFDSANVMTTPVNNPGVIQVGETSSTTGPRSATTDWAGTMPRYVDPGAATHSYDIEVPVGGLTVSGYLFTSIKIKTHNPLTFKDCSFSGQTDYHANVTPPANSYVVWDDNTSDLTHNGMIDFEYCDFLGAKTKTMLSRFRRLYKCRFDHTKGGYLNFRTAPAYRIDNCWFGPNMNIEDNAALNGSNGQYSPGQFSPHSDVFQIYLAHVGTIAVNNCTFETRMSVWGDGTTNPDHHRGSSPNRIFMIGGSATAMGDIREIYWNNCIFHGSGNYLFGVKSQTLVQTPRDFYFTNCKMGTGTSSRYFSWGTGPTNTTVHATGNTWLETGTRWVKLPPEALAAGQTTNLGRDTLDVNVLLAGPDYINFGQTGLNKSGLSAWSKRATPI